MISPALQNILDRAKTLRDHSDGLRFDYASQVVTALELVVKQNEMLYVVVQHARYLGSEDSPVIKKLNEALAECAKIDEELGRLK